MAEVVLEGDDPVEQFVLFYRYFVFFKRKFEREWKMHSSI